MRLLIAAIAALSLAAGCARDGGVSEAKRQQQASARAASTAETAATDTTGRSQETFALGSAVDFAGAMPANSTGDSFVHGGPVYLSINVASASNGQMIEVQWVAPDGRALHREQRQIPQHAQYAAFTSGTTSSWPEGQHRAVVLIDGRKVTEKAFILTHA